MTGAYIAYPYDENDLPALDADLQSGLATKQDAAAFLTTLVGIGGTSGSGNLARVTSPVLVTPVASRYNLSASTNVSELSAGVVQIGTTAANALGSLACANVTCGPGLVSAPALTLGDAGTGFYKVATNQIGVTVNGVDTFRFSNGNVVYCFQDFVTYGKLQFGTQSNTTPMLKKTGTSLGVRLSDDSADAPLTASNVTASGTVTLGTYTVATLPSAAANTRARAFVTNSNLAFNSTNLGSTVTAGGSTLVPVFSNGTNWVIG